MPASNVSVRPPVVAVLGHVDHGKTSLLDKIRNTNLASREAGGITQSIGAWQVKTKEGKRITFIDTPGHEAFKAMRSRGAKLADIAILVVAADDGIMPQTKESLGYLQEARTPFIVAITKTDLQTSQPEVVKGQLAQEGVLLEGRGGDIIVAEVSNVTGKGIEELLEMISLLWDVSQVESNPDASPEAVVIETQLDKRRGPVVSCVVKNGTLRIGQEIGTEGILTNVRGLFNENGQSVQEAGPGIPVEILGFSKLPSVGSVLTLGGSPAEAVIEKKVPLKSRKKDGFWIILKADTAGSLEAIQAKLENIGIVTSGVGDISEADVARAQAAKAPVVGFNVKINRDTAKVAEEEGVKVYNYKIIYELLEDVERWRKELEEAGKDKILGKATIIAQFPHDKKRIAGCRLTSGRITKSDKIRLTRNDISLGNVRALSLKKAKAEVDKVEQGEEFGIYFEPQLEFEVGDTIEAYVLPKISL